MTQDEALAILKTGANVFLTGEPGSGKTYTVNSYVAYLNSCGIEPAITASTGIAATHIGCMTIHSWCGIGERQRLTPYDLDAIAGNKRVMARREWGTATIVLLRMGDSHHCSSDDEVSELKWVDFEKFKLMIKDEKSMLVPHAEEYDQLIKYIENL